MRKQMTTDAFIKKARLKHGDRYDYTLTEYKGYYTKIKIICPDHGEFMQTPPYHFAGYGCSKCNGLTKTDFIKKAILVHGNKYNYSNTIYIDSETKLNILCPDHGEFMQTPHNHKKGKGCSKCVGQGFSKEEIIAFLNKIHNNKYNYLLNQNYRTRSKIKIICPEHGEFEQKIEAHKRGKGCQICGGNNKKDDDELISLFNEKHNNYYDYSLVEYHNFHTPIKIVCPNHGQFIQTPNNHKRGQGCPVCCESKGERKIRNFLIENNIKFIPQYKFKDCKNKRALPFDFYLPENNICIEFNGKQHYESIKRFGGEISFENLKNRDKIKTEYCKKNNIPLIVIKYNENINKRLLEIKGCEISI